MSDEDVPVPVEYRNPESRSRYVIHWITHARRRGLGMWAWLFHRVTGVILLFAVVLHVLAFQFGFLIPGGRFITVDLLLFAGVYHALNGARVVLIETYGWVAKREDRIFIIVLVATVLFICYWIYAVGL